MKNKNRPHIVFYLLVLYVITAFVWWGYLLLEKNKQIAHLKRVSSSDNVDLINYKEVSQQWMIVGEGVVFLVFLSIGIYLVQRYFMREIRLEQQQKNFLLSITHELKSPIASLKLALQTNQKRADISVEQRKALHQNSMNDIERLETLVDNLLATTKLENSSYQYNFEYLDLSQLVKGRIYQLEQLGETHIKYNIEEGIGVSVDKETFISVIDNLLDNALRYKKPESAIVVDLKTSKDKIELTVYNDGEPISNDSLAKVFDKFYRVGDEHTRSQKGTGLGLFIVKRVVQNHEGTVVMKGNDGKIKVVVTLPKAAES